MDKINSITHALDLAQKEFESWKSKDPKALRLWQRVYIRNFIIQKISNPKFNLLDFALELVQEESEQLAELFKKEKV